MSTESTLGAEVLAAVLEAADTAFAVTDPRGRIRWTNRPMDELLGLTGEQAANRSLPALLAGVPGEPAADGVVLSLATVNGGHRWVEVRCIGLPGDRLLYRAADVSRWHEQTLDPGERGEWHLELVRLADEDPLTGLLNRRALTRELERRLATGCNGALLVFDLDNFKDINDLRGHPAGDRVLRLLADVLRDRLDGLGGERALGRLGGDEFGVLLADTDAEAAVKVAELLRHAVAAKPPADNGATGRTTVSGGVAEFRAGDSWQAVLANADLALHASKSAGRNRVTAYEHGHYTDTALRVTVLDRVRDALANGGLALHAMPMVKLGSNRVVGHELLLRLEDGREPYLGPGEFLPAVESGDLVFDIDRWVVGTAIDTLVEHPYPGLRFNVNVSGRTLEDEEFGDFVLGRIARAGVAPGRLGFEITETAAVTNLARGPHPRAAAARQRLPDLARRLRRRVRLVRPLETAADHRGEDRRRVRPRHRLRQPGHRAGAGHRRHRPRARHLRGGRVGRTRQPGRRAGQARRAGGTGLPSGQAGAAHRALVPPARVVGAPAAADPAGDRGAAVGEPQLTRADPCVSQIQPVFEGAGRRWSQAFRLPTEPVAVRDVPVDGEVRQQRGDQRSADLHPEHGRADRRGARRERPACLPGLVPAPRLADRPRRARSRGSGPGGLTDLVTSLDEIRARDRLPDSPDIPCSIIYIMSTRRSGSSPAGRPGSARCT